MTGNMAWMMVGAVAVLVVAAPCGAAEEAPTLADCSSALQALTDEQMASVTGGQQCVDHDTTMCDEPHSVGEDVWEIYDVHADVIVDQTEDGYDWITTKDETPCASKRRWSEEECTGTVVEVQNFGTYRSLYQLGPSCP